MISRKTGWRNIRKRAVITAFALILLACDARAVPYEKWDITFGGKTDDGASYIQQAKDGGYIIAGYTGSSGMSKSKAWLIKTDTIGSEQWNRTFGEINRYGAYFVQQTKDEGFIVAGYTELIIYGGFNASPCLISSIWNACSNVWLLKTDSNGIEQWNRTFGGKGFDTASSVQETKDGGYLIAGSTDAYGTGGNDIWLIKTDANGMEQWNRTFGGKGIDEASYVSDTSDGGYIIAGYTESFNSESLDAWLIKTDANGIERWNSTFGGKDKDYAYSVQQNKDGGYIIAGAVRSFEAGTAYAFIIKTDENGKELWNKTFVGKGTAVARSIRQTPDGGYIAAGETSSNGEHPDAWLIKLYSKGTEQWSKVFGGIRDDTANSIQLTREGGYIFAGSRTDLYGDGFMDAWVVKLDEGEAETKETFPGIFSPDIAKDIVLKNLDNDLLNRTPEIVDASLFTDEPARAILTFKDPDSPARTIVSVDMDKKTIDSVEKISWNLNFPLYFNITSNPSGAYVYLAKYSPELCGPAPHKPGSDLIGKTPLTYKYEFNETSLPLSGLFSLFSFISTGFESESMCINIYGSENSGVNVNIFQEGYFETVPGTNLTFNINAKLKPSHKINKGAGFEILLAITALLMAITMRHRN